MVSVQTVDGEFLCPSCNRKFTSHAAMCGHKRHCKPSSSQGDLELRLGQELQERARNEDDFLVNEGCRYSHGSPTSPDSNGRERRTVKRSTWKEMDLHRSPTPWPAAKVGSSFDTEGAPLKKAVQIEESDDTTCQDSVSLDEPLDQKSGDTSRGDGLAAVNSIMLNDEVPAESFIKNEEVGDGIPEQQRCLAEAVEPGGRAD